MSEPIASTAPTAAVTAADLIGSDSPATPPPAAESPAASVAPIPPAPQSPPPNPFPGVRDSLGRDFDPRKFRLKDGKPQLDKVGRFCPAASGRKSPGGAPSGAPKPSAPPPAPGASTPPESPAAGPSASFAPPMPSAPTGPDRFDLAADVYCRGFYAFADAAFAGKGEWMPDDDTEHGNLRTALATYMRAKGAEELPPGPALALAALTYGAKRVQRPNTNTRIRDVVSHLKNRFAAWRTGRRLAGLEQVQVAPQPPRQPAPGPEAAAAYLASHGAS